MNWLAFDVGGANLKVADGRGFALVYPFQLWKDKKQLARELRTLLAESPKTDHLAVTMTGELADCFEDKEEGVRFIVESLQEAADGRHTRVYLTDGKLVAPQIALREPLRAAASNWHALGRFAARYAAGGSGLVLDIGSTTTDILPVVNGRLDARGSTDTERLLCGELVYTGVDRTPVCGVLQEVPYRGQKCPLAMELFATMLDAYVLTNDAPENPASRLTADGRPATKGQARIRLGRLIGSPADFNHRDAVSMAQAAAAAQVERIEQAARKVLQRMPAPPQTMLISGAGEFLARRVAEKLAAATEIVPLSAKIGKLASRAAPAHALAVLAREAMGLP